jgi:alpha-maltose-1-phosphate synthase
MIILSHPTGNANVRSAARALNEAGLLSEFWTSVCWNEQNFLNRVLPRSVSRELGRRDFSEIGRDQLHCHPWVELGRLAARQLKVSRLLRHEVGWFSVDAVYRSLDFRVAARVRTTANARGVYAYEDGASATFRAARQRGMKTIYELPIGYWRCYQALMLEEAYLQPEWAVTLQGRDDSDEKLRRKDEELALATDIVVPSEFVRSTLRKAGCLEAQVTVVPYGAPLAEPRARRETNTRNDTLKVIFVGGLSQRKGLSYLLQAVARLGSKVELTLVGRRVAECPTLDAALRVHRWIPSLPHAAVLEEISRHDVMVFPSLFEGFSLVLLEAMSQGVPVITTPNTGGPHFVSEGEDGFIVPIRDVEAIVERLELLLFDRDRLRAMGQAAMRKAAQHSWKQYRHQLANTVYQALTRNIVGHSPKPQCSHSEVCPSC